MNDALLTFRCWQLRALPTWNIGFWNLLLGNVDMLKPNHHLMLREAGKALGGIYKIRLAWLQVYVLPFFLLSIGRVLPGFASILISVYLMASSTFIVATTDAIL